MILVIVANYLLFYNTIASHFSGMEEYGLSQEISLPLRVPEVSPRVTGLIADSLVPSGGIIALHLQIQGKPFLI